MDELSRLSLTVSAPLRNRDIRTCLPILFTFTIISHSLFCYILSSSIMNSIPPPPYGCGAVYGISSEIDELIIGKAPKDYLHSMARISRLTNTARRYRLKMTSLAATREALGQVFCSSEQGWPNPELVRQLGLRSLPSAIFHDIVKPPYHLARMTVALSQSEFEKRRAEEGILNEILESLSISLETVFKMLIRLRLKTQQTLKQQIYSGDFSLFLTLARLLEAYGSRFAPPGVVYLASRKTLPKEYCSGIARIHFDQIHNLKDALIFVDLPPTHTTPDAATVIEQWGPRVLRALERPFMHANENLLFSQVMQKLRQTRDELPNLILREAEEAVHFGRA